jgi:chromate reductase, NAD(P)H dehydrogenase (quinone)
MKPMTLLGICGSLRKNSSNRALLSVAARLTAPGTTLEIDDSIGTLPFFDPDLAESPPQCVQVFRHQLAAADAIIIASPEYAHGVPGAMKNALDWVVGSGEFSGKPVAVINASFRSFHAHDALTEIIRTMDARIVPEASIRVPLASQQTVETDISNDSRLAGLLEGILRHLAAAVSLDRSPGTRDLSS